MELVIGHQGSKITDDVKVVCSFDNKGYPSIWTFLRPEDDEEQKIHEAETYYTNFPEYNRKYQVMTLSQYEQKEAEVFNASCKQIDYEKYDEMLCVLPPIYINVNVDKKFIICNAFLVSEPLSGIYYHGVVHFRYNDKDYYATKIVDKFSCKVKFETSDLEKIVAE